MILSVGLELAGLGRLGAGLDATKLRSVLEAEDEKLESSASAGQNTLADQARAKLTASRFRFLNEKLYTQESELEIFSPFSNIFKYFVVQVTPV